MATFISFDEFSGVLAATDGMLLFVLTPDCNDAGLALGRELERSVGTLATVYLMCAAGRPSVTVAFYRGGDARPLLTREGVDAVRTVREDLEEATRGVATEQMLATEQLSHFPPFFQMARTLARDAWLAARSAGQGAPLLLTGEAAAARLGVCAACPSLHGDRCVECGCYMTVKAHLAAMHCPLGKWPQADSTTA